MQNHVSWNFRRLRWCQHCKMVTHINKLKMKYYLFTAQHQHVEAILTSVWHYEVDVSRYPVWLTFLGQLLVSLPSFVSVSRRKQYHILTHNTKWTHQIFTAYSLLKSWYLLSYSISSTLSRKQLVFTVPTREWPCSLSCTIWIQHSPEEEGEAHTIYHGLAVQKGAQCCCICFVSFSVVSLFVDCTN